MRIVQCFAAALGVFFILSAPAGAASPADAMQKRYADVKSMRVEFSQVLLHKESGGEDRRSGVLYFAKPLLVRWETALPAPELLLVTPEAVWNAFPDEDVAYKYAPDIAESDSIVRIVTGQSALDKDFDVEVKGTEKGITHLALYPKKPTQSLTEAELWLQADGLIEKVAIIDFYYNRNEITFGKQDVNVDFPKTTFQFAPAKGMVIEDRTKGDAAPKPLMR